MLPIGKASAPNVIGATRNHPWRCAWRRNAVSSERLINEQEYSNMCAYPLPLRSTGGADLLWRKLSSCGRGGCRDRMSVRPLIMPSHRLRTGNYVRRTILHRAAAVWPEPGPLVPQPLAELSACRQPELVRHPDQRG